MKNLKVVHFMMGFFIVLGLLSGCMTGNEEKAITIAMIPKVMNINYFDKCAEGAQVVATKYDMSFIYKGPSTADAASQVNIVQDMIYEGVDVIAIAPIDPEAVKPILNKAREEGILVVTFDADASEESRDFFVSQVSAETLGKHIMDNVAKLIGDKGQYAIITASMTADNQNTWIEWIKEQNKLYEGIELLTIIPTDEDQQKAYSNTRNIMQAYPEIDALIAMSTEAGPAAASSVEAMGVNDQVKLYALALPNDMRPYIKSGAADLVTLWDPYQLGVLTAEAIYKHMETGELMSVDNYGNLENINYDEVTQTLIMGQPLDFDSSNIDAYDF